MSSSMLKLKSGEVVPWDSLSEQEKQDLWDNVWSKRIAKVVAEYIYSHPEQRQQILDALDWAREHPW